MKPIRAYLLFPALFGTFVSPSFAGERSEKPAKVAQLVIDVSAATINAAVQRTLDRTEPVEEVIQDTPVHGMGRTPAQVWAELIPDAAKASIDVVFRGCIDAETVGVRPHVLIYTRGTTPLEVRRRVAFDGAGIRSVPGAAFGMSTTTLLDITGHGDMSYLPIELARRAYPRSKPAAEAESACKAAGRVSDRLGSELSPSLEMIQQGARTGLTKMTAAGMHLESLNFSTTASSLQAQLRIAAPAGAAPIALPPIPADVDLAVRVHQSLINEWARGEYAERTIPVDKLSDFYDEVTQGIFRDEGNLPLLILGNVIDFLVGEPITITLAKKDPLSIIFADQGFTIEAHVASIRQGQAVYAGTRAKAVYRIETSRTGVHAIRVGPVRLPPADVVTVMGKKLPAPPDYFVFLEGLLATAVFQDRFKLNNLPKAESLPNLRFLPPRAGARDGWFGITWNLDANR